MYRVDLRIEGFSFLFFSRTQLFVEPQVRELQEQAVETKSVGDAEQPPV